MSWDPVQYGRYRDERSRPFFDLLARVPDRPYRRIADLGCGDAELTRALAERWPGARVTGVDRSAEMLAAARPLHGRLELVQGDLASWRPPEPLDLLVSNAALQWVPDHAAVLPRLAGLVAPGGAIAVQVPGNHDSPSHVELLRLAGEEPWRSRLEGRWRPHAVEPLAWYAETLRGLGWDVDAWETTYLHFLAGPDPVLEWMKGTALRPVLSLLGPDGPRFLEALAPRFRAAYPAGSGGTYFPFRRLFFVATRA